MCVFFRWFCRVSGRIRIALEIKLLVVGEIVWGLAELISESKCVQICGRKAIYVWSVRNSAEQKNNKLEMIADSKTCRTKWTLTISWLEKPQCNQPYPFHSLPLPIQQNNFEQPLKIHDACDLGEKSGTFSPLFFVVFLRSPGKLSEALRARPAEGQWLL